MPTYLANVATSWSEDHAVIVIADDKRHAEIRTENVLRDQSWTEDGIACAVIRVTEVPTRRTEEGTEYACPLCEATERAYVIGARSFHEHVSTEHGYFHVTSRGIGGHYSHGDVAPYDHGYDDARADALADWRAEARRAEVAFYYSVSLARVMTYRAAMQTWILELRRGSHRDAIEPRHYAAMIRHGIV